MFFNCAIYTKTVIKKKIDRILVPLDGSKNSIRGLEMAISIAIKFRATIIGVYSINIPPHSEFQRTTLLEKENLKEIKKILNNAKVLSAQNNVEYKGKIMQGDTGYNIVKLAHDKKQKIGIVVIGSRGRGAVKEIFLGSVSNYVIHASKIPVLLVK